MQNDFPDSWILLLFSRVEADTITPEVPYLMHNEVQVFNMNFFFYFMWIFDELQIELVEVCLDVNALHCYVVPVIH